MSMSEESPKTVPQKDFDMKAVGLYSKIIIAFVAVLGGILGVFQYLDAQKKQAESWGVKEWERPTYGAE